MAKECAKGRSKTGTRLAFYGGMKTHEQKLESLRRKADRAYARGDKAEAKHLRDQIDNLIWKAIKARTQKTMDIEEAVGPEEDGE